MKGLRTLFPGLSYLTMVQFLAQSVRCQASNISAEVCY